jgi:hypothetical protein
MAEGETAAEHGAASTSTIGDATTHDEGTDDQTDEATGEDTSGATSGREGESFDLRGIVRQFTAPMIESLDARLREQVEAHADALLDEKVNAAVSDRLATIERAIADLSRSLEAIERRVSALEQAGTPLDLE